MVSDSQTAVMISKAVQSQFSAILPSVIRELTLAKASHEQPRSAQTSRLVAGSKKKGLSKTLTPQSAAGSTQGSNYDCLEVTEAPSKKAKSSTAENDDCKDDLTIPAGCWELSGLLNVLFP